MKLKSFSFIWIILVAWSIMTSIAAGNIVYGIFNRSSQNDRDFYLIFPVLVVWFLIYCFATLKRRREREVRIKKRDLFFVILNLFVLNVVVEECFYDLELYGFYECRFADIWKDEELLIEIIICSCLLVVLLIYCIQCSIYLWSPLSTSCVIVAGPMANYEGGLGGAGLYVVLLGIAVVGMIIETVIMVLINRKKKTQPIE